MPKRFLPFGDLKRDGPDYDNASLNEARNVLPVYGVYRPVRKLQEVSSSDTITNFTFTPWLNFAGADSASKVDFTINPLKLPVPSPGGDFATIGLRFRTDTSHHGLICGAGLAGLVGFPQGFGWAMGTEASSGFVRFILGPGSVSTPADTVWSRVQIPGGYDDDDWHVLRADLSAFFPLDGPPFMLVQIHSGEVSGPESLTTDIPNAPNWTALDMRWGRGTQDTQRFQGDVERVLLWDRSPSDVEFEEMMNSPLDGLSPGGWSEADGAYPIRANTGTTVVNYGTVGAPGNGTMDTGVTWEGGDFELLARSGITGGIAHFYTRAQEFINRGPIEDIDEGEFQTFGRTHRDFPDDFFRQLWSEEPDDSRGVFFAVTDPQSSSGSSQYIGRFKALEMPLVDTDHRVEYRYQLHGTPVGDGATVRLAFYLDEGSTEIAELGVHETSSPDGEWHHNVAEILPASAALINNYGNLRIRVEAQIAGSQRQRAEPSADISNNDGWVNQDGGSADLWESIDDHQEASDTETWVETGGIASGGTSRARFKLSGIDDPQSDRGFNIRLLAEAVEPGVDVTARILEGGVERLRRKWTDIPSSPTLLQHTPQEENVAEIQDYGDLEAEVIFKAHGDPGDVGTIGLLPRAFDGPKVDTAGDIEDLRVADGNTVDVGAGGNGGRFRVFLEAGEDPGTNLDHRVRLQASRNGNDASVSVQVYSGVTQVYDSRDHGGPRTLPTSPGEMVFNLPVSATQQITPSGYQNLRIQVLTHAPQSGGTAHYDLLTLEYPGAEDGGRKGRLYSLVLATPSDLRGAVSWARIYVPDPVQTERGDVTELYAGDYKEIYRVENSPWSIVSKAGGYAANITPRSWVFVPFGANVVATNKVDPVQVKAPTDNLFSDLITSTSKPQAAAACVVQRHLILGNIEYTGAGGGDPDGQADEWWCSAFDDPADFDISLTTQSNRGRILSSPGEIVCMVGGDFATVIKQKSVHRLDWVGPPAVFREQVVSSSDGTIFPRGVVQLGRDVYFLDTDGFKVCRTGQRVEPIGVGAVNRMVTDSAYERRAVQPVDTDEIPVAESVVVGAYDRITGCIWWSLRTIGAQGDDPAPAWQNNVIVIYNPSEDRWAVIEPISPQVGEQEDGGPSVPGPPVGSDEPLRITHMFSLPVQKEASDSVARGIGTISIRGTFPGDYSLEFARFLGQETYSALVETKVWSSKIIAEDIREVLINFLRPSYRMAPEPTADPIVEATVFSADDPLMQFGVEMEAVDLSEADDDMWYPLSNTQGEFFIFQLLFPNLVDMTIREINGLELDFEDAGEY